MHFSAYFSFGIAKDQDRNEFLHARTKLIQNLLQRYHECAIQLDEASLEIRFVTPEILADIENYLQKLGLRDWIFKEEFPNYRNIFGQTTASFYTVTVHENIGHKDINQAAFVPLRILGENIDMDECWKPINAHTEFLCSNCFAYDESKIPDSYLISDDCIERVQDLYNAHNGMIIASEKALNYLQNIVGDAIQYGDAKFREPIKKKKFTSGRFFWIRPKVSLGRNVKSFVLKSCPACGRPIQMGEGKLPNKFDNCRIILEQIGDGTVPIALSGSWIGLRTREASIATIMDIFISGKLYSFLKKSGLVGLAKPEGIVHTRAEMFGLATPSEQI